MGIEETKDLPKNVDWKTLGKTVTNEASGPIFQKRLPKKLRQVPDYYFLPRRSIRSALALSTIVCAAGVGAGMLVEIGINKKIQGLRATVKLFHCNLEITYSNQENRLSASQR